MQYRDMFMTEEEAAKLKIGDRVEMLVGGCGDVFEEDDTEELRHYLAGDDAEIVSVDRYVNSQKLAVGIETANGVFNVFDAGDYDGKYPFKRI